MSDGKKEPSTVARLFPTWRHYILFARVAAWTMALPVLIRILSLPRLMKVLTPRTPALEFNQAQLEHTALINSYVVAILKRRPENVGRMCLRRSLVIYRYARLAGIPAYIRMGVKKEKDELVGHAWVEIGGQKRHDPRADVSYAVTFSYPTEQVA